MAVNSLKFVTSSVVDELLESISKNLALYTSGDFGAMSLKSGWAVETKDVEFDPDFAKDLVHSNAPEAEAENSLRTFEALQGMSPSLAREERIWVRLCHLECLEYVRTRWIGATNPARDVKRHFFAATLDQCRDDNAIGRLWWNGYLANQIDPENPEGVLKQILKRANIRLQFVDRSNASFRMPLAKGIVRLLSNEPWLDSHDRAFEHYMLALDRNAGGLLFEALSEAEIDSFLSNNLPLAKKIHIDRVGG